MNVSRFFKDCWYRNVGSFDPNLDTIYQCTDKTEKFVRFAVFSPRKSASLNCIQIMADVNGIRYYYHGVRRFKIEFNGVSETASVGRATISAYERVA